MTETPTPTAPNPPTTQTSLPPPAPLALPVLPPTRAPIETLLQTRPLYINIETTNVCNARCTFCAYPKMQRVKSVMDPALFAKAVHDYADLGGGAVSLTPIVGDALLDPHLCDRLALLGDAPQITNVGLTTNGIAWPRRTPDQRRFILEHLDTISFSIGGLDARTYETMFGIDRFAQVRDAVESVCDLKTRLGLNLAIHLMFRVNRPVDEVLTDPHMAAFRRPEIDDVSAINRFGNWGGLIRAEDLPPGAYLVNVDADPQRIHRTRQAPCFVHYLSPEITVSGQVSACGCMNAEADELILGDLRTQHLGQIWTGPARRRLLDAYGTTAMPDICQKCSYYQDGPRFIAQPAFKHFEVGDNPWDVLRTHSGPGPADRLAETLDAVTRRGFTRLALYGAGSFTRRALSGDTGLDLRAYPVRAILDDNPELIGTTVRSLPILSPHQALDGRFDAVILATDHFTEQLWRASLPLRNAGIHIEPLTPTTT